MLLWLAVILMAIGGLLVVLGCILAKFFPQGGLIVAIIGGALTLIGWLLMLLWWLLCSSVTACSVILAVRAFVIMMIFVFGLIAIVLAILALAGITDLWPCAAAAALYGFNWRAVLAIIDAAAIRLGCLTVNPSGAGGASSSSSGLMSGAGDRSSSGLKYNGHARITGLGDVIKVTTSAMGIQPCTGCKERARQLNRLVPSVTDDVR